MYKILNFLSMSGKIADILMEEEKKQPIINPAFQEKAEEIIERIRKNIHNLEHSDLEQLESFTKLKEYHI